MNRNQKVFGFRNKQGEKLLKLLITSQLILQKIQAKNEKNRIACQIAGDNEKQKKIVMKLIEDIGFEPYDNGNLDNSWSQQPNSAGYCCDYTCEELKQVKEKQRNQSKLKKV